MSARLTPAGMNRGVPGAVAVAVVRAWRNRDRRDDALRLRSYRRQAAAATAA
ncbi:MAG: hypothetical protein KGS47_06830 [Chloroflexi bacterium]|nr:hypothetical protein [Chloroflexota bacterium]